MRRPRGNGPLGGRGSAGVLGAGWATATVVAYAPLWETGEEIALLNISLLHDGDRADGLIGLKAHGGAVGRRSEGGDAF